MKSQRDSIYILGVSLGTNCAAVLVNESGQICGYEEERFTLNKRESSYPINSVNECLKQIEEDATVYVGYSHWFDKIDVIDLYRYYKKLEGLVEIPLNTFDHHYLHSLSSSCFVDYPLDEPVSCLVIDGFGNNKSTVSIYRYQSFRDLIDPYNAHNPVIRYRDNNLSNSLGLFYEALTRACGLKPKGDEYKLLGYESSIEHPYLFEKDIDQIAQRFRFFKFLTGERFYESIIDFQELDRVEKEWDIVFQYLISKYSLEDLVKRRVTLAYIGQSVLEKVVGRVVVENGLATENLLLSGGVFYNVKLNNTVLNICKKRVDVCPVAGDQGGAIGVVEGMYRKIFRKHLRIKSLKIGSRDIGSNFDRDKVVGLLCDDNIVNLVRGDMEFGPRALCSTSTLALPYHQNVNKINIANKRDDAMPMAPVLRKENLDFFFYKEDYERCEFSLPYMIQTLKYKDLPSIYRGVMHNHPTQEIWTGRPQVITKESDPDMYYILEKVEEETGLKCLINTSFNIHGHPIVRDRDQANDNFLKQVENLNNAKLNSKEFCLVLGYA